MTIMVIIRAGNTLTENLLGAEIWRMMRGARPRPALWGDD